MLYIQKRNNALEPFNKDKIIIAINKAFLEVDKVLYETDTANDIADEIEQYYLNNPTIELTVEGVQDLIEDALMRSERKDVAKSYIRFRYKKEVARNYSNDFIDAIREKLGAKNVQNQNANVDEHSFGGRIGEASGVVTKKLALEYLVSTKSKQNHENNEIYIHDLDNYYVGSHNCLSIPFDDLLANGFNTRQTDVRPASSVNTAFQLVAVIFQLQSLQQFGGVSATHLDWTMVPYVRKSFYKHFYDGLRYIEEDKELNGLEKTQLDGLENTDSIDCCLYDYAPKAKKYAIEMTVKEVKQAVEGMYHNLK